MLNDQHSEHLVPSREEIATRTNHLLQIREETVTENSDLTPEEQLPLDPKAAEDEGELENHVRYKLSVLKLAPLHTTCSAENCASQKVMAFSQALESLAALEKTSGLDANKFPVKSFPSDNKKFPSKITEYIYYSLNRRKRKANRDRRLGELVTLVTRYG